MRATLLYCYDPYCGWCYGFSTVIRNIFSEYEKTLDFEVLSGGMVLPATPVHISAIALYNQEVYKRVTALTGVKFSTDYLWHINNPELSDWYPNSEKAAIALCIFREYFPGKQIEFINALQACLYQEGRDLTDDESYRHLLAVYDIPANAFYEKLKSETFKENAYEEFAVVKQLNVTGFPTVFVQIPDSKFYLVANGYTTYETLKQRIDEVLKNNSSAHLK